MLHLQSCKSIGTNAPLYPISYGSEMHAFELSTDNCRAAFKFENICLEECVATCVVGTQIATFISRLKVSITGLQSYHFKTLDFQSPALTAES